jgi:tRNA A-37 threonylcarbamoyl transferase component Bud32
MSIADERWLQVKQLLSEALDRDPELREPFLARACGGDAALRAEVESLLAQAGRTNGLIAEPLFDLTAAIRRLATADGSLDDTPPVSATPARHRSAPRSWFLWRPNRFPVITFGVSLRYREQLMTWLDRRFFREGAARETLLRDVLRRIKDAASVHEVGQLVAETVGAALHPTFICVISRNTCNGPFIVSHISGTTIAQVQKLDLPSQLLRHGIAQPFDVLPGADAEGSGPALAVPIVRGNEEPVGLLLLGEKQSNEPYGPVDRALLHGIADQMALVQDNLTLRSQVEEERRIRARRDDLIRSTESDVRVCEQCGAFFPYDVDHCSGDGSRLTQRLGIERIVAGKYRLERRIGQGGMAAVYEATDVVLHRRVAIKIALANTAGHHTTLRRFEREAESLARLCHRNIVRVFDFGQLADDGAYLVMERVAGLTWRVELANRRVLPMATIASWTDQLLDGLEATHDAGVVHRDVKPENVLIAYDRDGSSQKITLVDFGLAVLDRGAAERQNLTTAGMIMGTCGYMSPEQTRGEPCDPRSDLFAVATMVIEAITGAHPLTAPEPRSWVSAIASAMPRAEPGAIRMLQHVLGTCVAVCPSQRFHTAGEMRHALVPALDACARPRLARNARVNVASAVMARSF